MTCQAFCPCVCSGARTSMSKLKPGKLISSMAEVPQAGGLLGIQVLVSNLGGNALQVAETRKLVDMLENKKVIFEQVDGSSQPELRNKMWEKSGKRAYPQIFLNGEFWGDLDMIQVRRAPIAHAHSIYALKRSRHRRTGSATAARVPSCAPRNTRAVSHRQRRV